LPYAAGNAGGIVRDLLIGAVPPAAISDWRYLTVSLDHAKCTAWRDKLDAVKNKAELTGIVTFWRPFAIDRLRSPVLIGCEEQARPGRHG
jgi:Glycine transporter